MIIKKRRRKRKYKTGLHRSPKCPVEFKYRSGWELNVAVVFDNDPNVLSYEYESLEILYVSNSKTKKVRRYYPDFIVTYLDGNKSIIEVKRDDRINAPKTIKKAEACQKWAKEQKMDYQIWGLKKIKEEQIRVLGAIPKPPVKKKTRKKRKSTLGLSLNKKKK
jgi:hypothetical protein